MIASILRFLATRKAAAAYRRELQAYDDAIQAARGHHGCVRQIQAAKTAFVHSCLRKAVVHQAVTG